MTAALFGAVLAGALTTLAPCALTLLPVVVGGSLQGAATSQARRRVWLIAGALGASVFTFTLLLRATTALIDVPTTVWRLVSGGLLVALGLVAALPELWDRVSVASGMGSRSARGLASATRRTGVVGALLTGAALGPVFTSCSPLYAYVIVTVLPASTGRGLALLTAYVLGLTAVLLAIGLLGQRAVRRMRWAADPHSVWRRGLGVLFVVIGLLVATGDMQALETWILEHSPVAPWNLGPELPTGTA